MKINTIASRVIQTLVATATLCILGSDALSAETRPNILFCISDDQSYAHTGANGDPVVQTPAFDRIAREGLRSLTPFVTRRLAVLRDLRFSRASRSGV